MEKFGPGGVKEVWVLTEHGFQKLFTNPGECYQIEVWVVRCLGRFGWSDVWGEAVWMWAKVGTHHQSSICWSQTDTTHIDLKARSNHKTDCSDQ